ncbi:GntR family transcriptional regulator [Rossellomorea marisflavi]|uniref:GntR family transcriptional regulator n=1 Tax=Rossellomorea marisflavi TaxID=189381 RepID=UPI0006FA097A|nr:GntR family transcriptional regulator [Rossellomorea marisflavi]KQU63725.1 GntR family transcriptional regulator [Bacillus sp. Leaf406]MBV6684912.1 GntR family transcriptional regulator [Bacillus sp. JRC01]MDW4525859.1 GntR family transcriptional regulator [Rossellomorea marisflavi]WJV17729.1 GntR family transcriptional regulator [Rossellomorea marisflavi]
MLIQIEPHSPIPIYAQVRNGIVEGIVRGELKPGDVLPSVRSFAADLGVNMHTVNKSYHELEDKGIIQIVPKSGAVILAPDEPTKERIDMIASSIRPLLAEALAVGMTEEQLQDMIRSIQSSIKGE